MYDRETFGPAVRDWVSRNLDTVPAVQHAILRDFLRVGEWGIALEAMAELLDAGPARELTDDDVRTLGVLLAYINYGSADIERLTDRLSRPA